MSTMALEPTTIQGSKTVAYPIVLYFETLKNMIFLKNQ